MKIVAAMSGGVDSSVAAAVLKEEGHQVIGATMQVWPPDGPSRAVEDAKKAAGQLGIPHHVIDLRDVFARKVITEFCREYSLGRTPNPCIICNHDIKFGILLEKARELGADYIATGHYARIEMAVDNGRYLLKKGADRHKEQSYWLYSLTQAQLRHIILPLGKLTKEKVREIAGKLQLPALARPESQDICFIPDNNYPRFLKEHIPEAARPGPILDREGNILGEHRGIVFYTVGQRRNLGIAAREPQYVIGINPEKNAIVVGGRQEIYRRELTASRLNWIAIDKLSQPIAVSARVRHRHREVAATVIPVANDHIHVWFEQPQPAITPGQSVVFYQGDTVIGGGVID
ncbi:MAG TPA: tRNA 2-thiouridine(34) synthase MnmA [Dehalococcoidia bacterium]|nr:tRNA 2-thiouridine(34) synthase MnmA [Dehalococcoidia bacterium]